MKKVIACIVLLTLLFVYVLPVTSYAIIETPPLLSQMSDSELIDFIEDCGYELPSDTMYRQYFLDFVRAYACAREYDYEIVYVPSDFELTYLSTWTWGYQLFYLTLDYYTFLHNNYDFLFPTLSGPPRILDNIIYDTGYNANYSNYNCYSYALGITNRWLNIGFSQNPSTNFETLFTQNHVTSVNGLAEYVKADIKSLGHRCVRMQTDPDIVSSLASDEHLICFRINTNGVDFHFMKYENGHWWQKCGATNPMMYLPDSPESDYWISTTLSYGRDASNNLICVISVPSTPYESDIVYIAYSDSHGNWTYTNLHNNTHQKECSDCHDTVVEQHFASHYHPYSSTQHEVVCACQQVIGYEAHDFSVHIGARLKCSSCGTFKNGPIPEPQDIGDLYQ